MIVDIHTHTFPDKIAAATVEKLAALSHTPPFSDGTVSGLASSMALAGIDRSVVLPVATNPRQVSHVNDSSIRLNESGGPVVSFGCMHPDFPHWKEELSRIAAAGIRGIKLHPVYQGVDLDDVRYLRILDRCSQLGLAVLAHAGFDIGYPGAVRCSPAMSLRAVKQVGPVTLILAHMGGWRCWEEAAELLSDTGVYLDTSFSLGRIPGEGWYSPEEAALLSDHQFVAMVRTFGAHRILFGSDSPWTGQKECLSRLRSLPLTEEELDAILGGNAQKLLQLA